MLQCVLAIACFVLAATASTCYDTTGAINTGLQACDPTAATTPCCGNPDYCLSNGLCFNGGANNLLGNQGCTDQNWGSPCHRYCTGVAWATNLFPCSNAEMFNGEISYCCGPDSSCCTNASLVFSVPVGSVILRPSQLAAYFSTTSSMSTTAITPFTTTTSFTTTSSKIQSPTSIPPVYPPKNDSLALGLGLGLGLPFGLLLIGALVFLAWELRKNNQRSDARGVTQPDRAGNAQAEVQKAELPADCN